MANRSDIPHLIDLLDGASHDVRELVLRELLSFGQSLEDELAAMDHQLSPAQRRAAERILFAHRKAEMRWEAWGEWPKLQDPNAQMETAFELLAQFQYGWTPPVSLRDLLDDLSRDYLTTCHTRDALSLSRFLFGVKNLRGNREEYYAPLNSNLIHVIQNELGLPISLACIFILVGARCGVAIEGCCAPGHFLARARMGGRTVFFDCFDGGRMLTEKEIGTIRAQMPKRLWQALADAATPVDIIRRVLNNLIHAYDLEGDTAQAQLMRDLQGGLPILS
ncbi:MAG: transglutaminase family protein [Candidatus Hydrogenedentes bacterium]|nr:transglutaminase family protein [Candidatus Hydrogenedentota bacterium]